MKTKTRTSNNQIILLFICTLTLLFIVSMSTIDTSSAASTLYVNNATGNDDWDGTSATYQGGTIGPKATIQNASDEVDLDGTVNVASGTYTENLLITRSLSLIGENRDTTIIDGGGNDRVINVDALNFLIAHFTIQNGLVDDAGAGIYKTSGTTTINDCTLKDNTVQALTGGWGGGIYNQGGRLNIQNSLLTNNSVETLGSGGWGGALYDLGITTITNSQFNDNKVISTDSSAGGAIYNQNSLDITGSVFNRNSALAADAGGNGGAIYNHNYGVVTLVNTDFYDNLAQSLGDNALGGAIYSYPNGVVNIEDCHFEGNQALAAEDGGMGGAIFNQEGTLTIASSGFTENTAYCDLEGGIGGAILNLAGILTITDTTFTGNLAQADEMGGVAGAIANIGGNVTLTDTNFSGNMAQGEEIGGMAGAILNLGVSLAYTEIVSGGIEVIDEVTPTNTYMDIVNCDFYSNQALSTNMGGVAGAIGNIYSNLSITGSNFIINQALVTENIGGVAGAIANILGNVTLTDTNFSGNRAHATEIGGVAGAILNLGIDFTLFEELSAGDIIPFGDVGLMDSIENAETNLVIDNCDFDSNQAVATSMGGIAGAIFNLAVGDAVTNLSVTGSSFNNNLAQVTEDIGGVAGAIANLGGNATLTGSIFSGNVARAEEMGGAAGAILNLGLGAFGPFEEAIHPETTMNIASCDFHDNQALSTNIGGLAGAIGNVAIGDTVTNLSITDSTFTNNQAQTETTGGAAGAIGNYGGIVTITNSLLENNIAQADEEGTDIPTGKGGAIYNQNQLTVTGSTIKGNQAIIGSGSGQGGGIYNDAGTFQVNFNRIVENSPEDLYNSIEESQLGLFAAGEGSQYNAQYNWWGSNSDPYLRGRIVGEQVAYDPWMVMHFTANPATTAGSTATITADLRYDNHGNFHDPINGHIPDNTLVTFTTNLGNVGSKSVTVPLVNGIALAILRADEGTGLAWLTARLDSELLTLGMTINPPVTSAATTTKTIGMQETGQPVLPLILAGLMVLGGIILPRRIK